MKRLLLLLAALTVTGCASTYTGITKIDDNTYYVTRVKNAQSTLFVCSPIGETAALRCSEISTTTP
jgi:autotransporter-associated beta strand protein